MSVPGAAGPPERLQRTREIGPFTLTGRVGVGRRTTAYIGQRTGSTELLVVRELHQHVDSEVFQAELLNAKGLVVGAPAEPLARVGLAALATGPLIIGENLATILEDVFTSKRPIGHDLALAIAMGIARQLSLLGVVHGDLAPHHVLIGYDGTVRLIDPAGDAYRERAQAPGRMGYRSPEHVRAQPLGLQSDVFLLGVLLFEMTTARRLFEEATQHEADARIIEAQVPRPRDVVGDGYPIEMQLVLRKLLRPAPAGRFVDSNAARDALRLVATTRTEVGADHIGSWLRARLNLHHAAWREIVGDAAGEPVREEPTVALKRPPSRAKTKITAKSAPPAHRSLNLEDPELVNVKKQIEALEVEARALVASRDREDTKRLKQELKDLEPKAPMTIPDGPTQPRALPLPREATIPDPKESTLDEALENLLQRDTEPIKKRRSPSTGRPVPRGPLHPGGPIRPLELIPDLPTEVTPKRERPPAQDEDTPLDEIRAASDLFLHEDLTLPPDETEEPEELEEPETLEEPQEAIEDLEEPDRPTERPDLELLSADLVLGQLTNQQLADRAFAETLTADLLEPLPDLPGDDTIQDQNAEDVLGQNVVELMARVTSTPPPMLLDTKPSQARIDTQIIRERDLRPPQSEIDTQVVLDQIEQQTASEDLEPIIPGMEPPTLRPDAEEDTPEDAPYPGELPPTVQAPVHAARPHEHLDDSASLGELVIPISDAELARTRRNRWGLLVAVAAVPVLLLAGAFVLLGGEEPAKVEPIEATRLEVDQPPPPALPPPPPPEPAVVPDAGVVAVVEPPPPPPPPPPPVQPPPPPAKKSTRVRVRALPEEAIIVVDGDFEIDNGGVVEVKDKPVKVIARATGWEEKEETIEPGRTKDVLLLLKKAETN